MRYTTIGAVALLLVSPLAAWAGDPGTSAGGRVNQLKVLSDKTDDVTTVENILKSFVKPGMTDQNRAKALWGATVLYRHQAPPPNEHLAGDWEAHDPVKLFNVYGYCMCCCSSAVLEALNREDGREARGRILNGHSVPEVRYKGDWHMFDASLITFFPRPKDGVVASVDEIAEAVSGWYAKHPEYRNNPGKVVELMRRDGWTGWKAGGPALLANCPYYRAGYFPARTHGWDATMAEYDRKSEVYEYGYHVGHKALFSLRPGESFVREAGNRGLHVNMKTDPTWDGLKARAPENDLVYLQEYMPGYRGGVVGNGVHSYRPEIAAGDLARGAEVYENLTVSGSPATVRVKQAGRPGAVVVPMISPYVYLGGRLKLSSRGRGELKVSLSTNNGRSFSPIASERVILHVGSPDHRTIDLSDAIFRRYAYWVRIELSGGMTLERIEIENDFQHAPRTLPWLAKGQNAIRVEADGDAAIATRSFAFRIAPDPSFTQNETSTTMGVTFENVDLRYDACWWKGGTGTMTVPIDVPGDLVSLSFSAQVRVRSERDRVRIVTSRDGGRSWREAAVMAGPTQGRTGHFRIGGWPAGTRNVLVRFELTGNNTAGVQNVRFDADYRDPLAGAGEPVRPLVVVHKWRENGVAKIHVEPIAKLPKTYTIDTAADPEMVSVEYLRESTR